MFKLYFQPLNRSLPLDNTYSFPRCLVGMSEKDQVLFIDTSTTSNLTSKIEEGSTSEPETAFNEETGEINWVGLFFL